MAVGLVLTGVRGVPAYNRLTSSARSVRQYLRSFDRSGKELSPVERFAFSLLLANRETRATKEGSF
jgi:hypothetical protein